MAPVQMDIERMFAKRLQIYACVEFTLDSMLKGVLRIAFKAFLEHARMSTLTLNGFRQIQLDVQYIKVMLNHFVRDPTSLENLLAEIVASSAERCVVTPVALEPSIIAAITSTKKAKFRFI